MAQTTANNPFGSMTVSGSTNQTSDFSITDQTFVIEDNKSKTSNTATEGSNTIVGSLVAEFKDKPLQIMTKELLKDLLFLTPVGWVILACVGIGMLIYKFRGEIKSYSNDLQELVNYIVK